MKRGRSGGPGITAYFALASRNSCKGEVVLKNQRKISWLEEQIWTPKFSAADLSTPSLGIIAPTLSHSKPEPFACHFRNLWPVRGTGRLSCSELSLFSESQQLPLTGPFSPTLLPPAPRTSGWSLEALGLSFVFSEGLMLTPRSCASRGCPLPPFSNALHLHSWGSPV